MAKSKVVQVFPSEDFLLKADLDAVPLYWLIPYLEQIMRFIPAESRKSALFSKWKGSVITYEKALTPTEELEEGLDGVVANLELVIANNKGLTKAELVALVSSLKTL
jgi:hypothetical protein